MEYTKLATLSTILVSPDYYVFTLKLERNGSESAFWSSFSNAAPNDLQDGVRRLLVPLESSGRGGVSGGSSATW